MGTRDAPYRVANAREASLEQLVSSLCKSHCIQRC